MQKSKLKRYRDGEGKQGSSAFFISWLNQLLTGLSEMWYIVKKRILRKNMVESAGNDTYELKSPQNRFIKCQQVISKAARLVAKNGTYKGVGKKGPRCAET